MPASGTRHKQTVQPKKIQRCGAGFAVRRLHNQEKSKGSRCTRRLPHQASFPTFLVAIAELKKNGCPIVRSKAVTNVGLRLSLNKASPKKTRNMSSMPFPELIFPIGRPPFDDLLAKARCPHS